MDILRHRSDSFRDAESINAQLFLNKERLDQYWDEGDYSDSTFVIEEGGNITLYLDAGVDFNVLYKDGTTR